MTPSARAAALRSTALATSLALAVGLSALAADASAKPKVPLPKPRPIARNVVPKTTSAANTAASRRPPPAMPRPRRAPPSIDARDAPACGVAAAARASRRRRPRSPRPHRPRRPTPTRWRTSSSWSASTSRRMRPRPRRRYRIRWRRKLAEWIILRSDDNGASVERYRAFIAANPSWPSQTFLRRRLEAALWDDHRDDATVWAWFENESPLSAKGKFSLARAMLARGDRANAERLVRDAWRNDSMSEDTENTALDLFGALLTPGDQKARMDLLLYGSEHEAALRAAKRLGSRPGRAGEGAHRGLSQGLQHQGAARGGSARTARRSRLHLQQDPAAPPRREIRRGRPAHAERAEGSRPPVQSRRMVDRAAAAVAQDARRRRAPHRLSDRARRRPARARHLQDRAGIHRGLDRAALPERSGDGRAAFRAHRRRQRQPDHAGARRLLAGPRRGSRGPLPGGPRRLHRGRGAIDQLLRPAGARQTRPAADRAERRAGRPRRAASNGWRSSARCNCSTSWTSAKSRSRSSPTWARTAIPTRWWGSANWPRATAMRAACCCSARPRSIAGCRSISMPIR